DADNIHFANFTDITIDALFSLPTVVAKIGSITIAGRVQGTPNSIDFDDFYGFAAEQIDSLKIGGASVALHAGPGNDGRQLGPTGDAAVHELGTNLGQTLLSGVAALANASTVT